MVWTKERLQSECNLADDDVIKTLKVCGLPLEQQEYSDEDIEHKFKVVRSYFDSNRTDTYTGAADLFQQETGISQQALEQPEADNQPTKKVGKGKKLVKTMNFDSLRTWVTEEVGTKVSPIELGGIIQACGLPDQEEYSQDECDRVRDAADMYKKQSKTYKEIAAHFGVGGVDEADNLQQIVEQVSDTAVSTDEELVSLVDKVTDKQAEGLTGLVKQSYLKNASRRLAESRANDGVFFAELEKRIMARIEEKSPARILMKSWEREANSLPPSSPKPMSLPEGPEDGTSGE